MSRGSVQRFVVGSLTENLGLKITAFLCAILMYSFMHGAEDAQRPVYVDVVTIVPEETSRQMLVSEVPDQVKLILRGTSSVLNALSRESIAPVQVDLRNVTGRYYYFDRTSFEDIPAGVQIVEIQPESFPLRWAERTEKSVSVSPNVVGDSLPGTRVKEVHVDPVSAIARGPQSELAPIAEARTEPVDLTGMTVGSHALRVPIQKPGPNIAFAGGGQVRVVVDIEPILTERSLRRLEIAAVGTSVRAHLRPDHVSVVLRGPPESMADLDEERIVPYVDLSEFNGGGGASATTVHIRGVPDGIEVLRVEPSEVLVSGAGRR